MVAVVVLVKQETPMVTHMVEMVFKLLSLDQPQILRVLVH